MSVPSRRLAAAVLGVLLSSAPALGAEGLKFLRHGQPVKSLSLEEVKALVPLKELTVFEPHEEKDVTYRGFPAKALLDKVYGAGWEKDDEVVMTCSDGFQPSVPSERFSKFDGYLTIERLDGPFKIRKKEEGEKVAELGPFYLVWDNVKSKELRGENLLYWPYQVVTLDLVDAASRFPHMAPPKGASAAVKRGFSQFRQNCFACHSINGDGGEKAFDLNSPVSVTEYWKEAWLEKWIVHPAGLRPKTAMPDLVAQGKEGEKIAKDVVAYLKAMAKHKRKL